MVVNKNSETFAIRGQRFLEALAVERGVPFQEVLTSVQDPDFDILGANLRIWLRLLFFG